MKSKILVYALLPALILATTHIAEAQKAEKFRW